MSLDGVPRRGERVGVAIVSIILHTYNGGYNGGDFSRQVSSIKEQSVIDCG
jgi:hypothetical protein